MSTHEDELGAVCTRLEGLVPAMDGMEVIVAGSAAMVLHGIELGRIPGDIDLFVPTEDWFALYESWRGDFNTYVDVFTPDPEDPRRLVDPPYLIERSNPDLPVHIFFGWRYRPLEGNWDVADMFRSPDVKHGWPVASLDVVYQQKMQARRPKDLRDMAAILEHTDGEIQ
jgi:hypothetical protein